MLAAACRADILRAQSIRRDSRISTGGRVRDSGHRRAHRSRRRHSQEPGAREIIDRALAGYDRDRRDLYRRGLADIAARRARSSRVRRTSEEAGAEGLGRLGETTFSRHLMGNLPDGRRSEDERRQSLEPCPRCAEPVRGGWSSPVTSARQQPTATIQALAYRTAACIQESGPVAKYSLDRGLS